MLVLWRVYSWGAWVLMKVWQDEMHQYSNSHTYLPYTVLKETLSPCIECLSEQHEKKSSVGGEH